MEEKPGNHPGLHLLDVAGGDPDSGTTDHNEVWFSQADVHVIANNYGAGSGGAIAATKWIDKQLRWAEVSDGCCTWIQENYLRFGNMGGGKNG